MLALSSIPISTENYTPACNQSHCAYHRDYGLHFLSIVPFNDGGAWQIFISEKDQYLNQ